MLEIEFKGAVMKLSNLCSRQGSQTYQLILSQGVWPREDELEEFFREFRANTKLDADVDVHFIANEAIVVVHQ